MKTLILGNGLIAKGVARKIVMDKRDVVIASRNIEDKIDHVSYEQCSLEEISSKKELFDGVDTIIHTISTSAPSNSMSNIYQDAFDNILQNIKLIELISKLKDKRFIFLSSGGAVYGNPAGAIVNETHTTSPISAYGVAKLSVEKYLHLYGYHFGLNYLIIRPSNIYGFIKNIKKPQGVVNHLLDCAFNNKAFKLWGSIHNSKDYLYIDDFAEALILALNHKTTYPANIYNISFGKTHSLAEIVEIVETKTGQKITIEPAGESKFDVKNINVDSSLFKHQFNWKPFFDIETGIEKIVEQY